MTKKATLAGLAALVMLALLAAGPHDAWAASDEPATTAAKPSDKVAARAGAKTTSPNPGLPIPLPRARPQQLAAAGVAGAPAKTPAAGGPTLASLAPMTAAPRAPAPSLAAPAASAPAPARAAAPLAYAINPATPPADIAILKEAITLARNGKTAQVADLQKSLSDPLARKLVEWTLLRSDNNTADSSRYTAFIGANPSWPSIGLLRRRAEAMLWQEQAEPSTVRAFFGKEPPLSAKGRLAHARALLALGDRAGAQALVRGTWRNDALSSDLEDLVLDTFKDLLTAADHHARMEMRLYVEDTDAGLRAANRAGGTAAAISKGWVAVIRKAANAKALLDAVPAEASRDLGYIFARAQWLRRAERAAEAAELILSAPRDPAQAIDSDQWWVERRLVARKLLDLDDAPNAYRIARDAAVPSKENYRAEHQFTAGWIALRFLNDPSAAMAHFAKLAQGNSNPIAIARAGYWQGRAAEAMGRSDEARAYFEAAARHGTAYYGQIARARLGYQDIVVRSPPELSPERRAAIAQLEVVRAAELLYAVNERDLVVPFVADLGERSTDISALAALGEITARNKDARSTLLVGKAALARGYALEHYAFPTIGIPEYRPIGPTVDPSIVYAIARQESQFYQGDISTAKAMGLMQVTPEAGRETAKKFGAPYDVKRLLSDPVYNVQMGAGELGDLLEGYRGSYILTFAGYNAGRGRVREWLSRYGDPRDPQVDPVDWVERIPFSETRNYVERVLENLQVYRVRLGGGPRLLIEADLRRGASTN
jgi:soluble lytic murein transglycosylase